MMIYSQKMLRSHWLLSRAAGVLTGRHPGCRLLRVGSYLFELAAGKHTSISWLVGWPMSCINMDMAMMFLPAVCLVFTLLLLQFDVNGDDIWSWRNKSKRNWGKTTEDSKLNTHIWCLNEMNSCFVLPFLAKTMTVVCFVSFKVSGKSPPNNF